MLELENNSEGTEQGVSNKIICDLTFGVFEDFLNNGNGYKMQVDANFNLPFISVCYPKGIFRDWAFLNKQYHEHGSIW